LQARRELRKLNDEIDLVVTAADAIVDLEVDLASLPAWRLAGYRRTIRDLAWRIAAAEVSASSAASASYRALELVLARWLDEPLVSTWAQRLTAGTLGRHGAGARLDRELRDAVEATTPSTGTIADPARTEPDPIARLLDDREPVEAHLPPALARAARRAGSRAVYGGPTWEEAPQLVWQRIRMAATHRKPQPVPDRAAALDELAELLRSRRSWKYIRIATGQIVDLRLRLIDQMSRTAAQALRMRERAKSALLTLGGEERRGIVEITARLIESHQIRTPEDVELLADRELTGMLLGAPPPPSADLHWRRAVARRTRRAPPLPDVFTGYPGVMQRAAASGHVLAGWSASPGKAEAPARVVTDLADAVRLRSGEILVATATDPSWTSIIVNAAAVVLETGGPLSHAAIVAREFGIPAVLKVADATRLIEDGELIAVDGHLGSVLRIERRGGVT
jgi:pyruvate,water dikinase